MRVGLKSEAMAGCKYVLACKSPFIIAAPEDENEIISPAVDGTLRVLVSKSKMQGIKSAQLSLHLR